MTSPLDACGFGSDRSHATCFHQCDEATILRRHLFGMAGARKARRKDGQSHLAEAPAFKRANTGNILGG
jgi:hypothetical protein